MKSTRPWIRTLCLLGALSLIGTALPAADAPDAWRSTLEAVTREDPFTACARNEKHGARTQTMPVSKTR